VSVAQRKFFTEVSALADRLVTVTTTTGKVFTGLLLGVNPDSMSLILSGAKDEEGKALHRVAINGHVVASVVSVEKPFDMKALSDRLEKVFPTMVKLYEDKGFIWVMDKVKVTERGVVEGSGPAAERVEKVYALFMNEAKGKS
jgi:small nuclear ribonucleoprotein (snRNP)-like protein